MIALHAARVLVEGDAQNDVWVTLEEGYISSVGARPPERAQRIELGDVDLIPGLIDTHSDCFEELAHPRPSADLPIDATLYELDALLVNWGITTNYLCITLDDDARKWRTTERALETEGALRRRRAQLRADHRVHLRIDITAAAVEPMEQLAAGGIVAMLSYMDHTPGSGQFADEAAWRKFYGRDISDAQADALLLQKQAGRVRADAVRGAVAACANRIRAVLVSHDDDSAESIALARDLGVGIAEFPVNAVAAAAARAAGIGIVMGAPNARRGRSHVANLSAREALAMDAVDGLVSDYHPPSLLGAAYALVEDGAASWPQAIGVVTSGPARIAGLRDRGRIAEGLRADLVAVDARGPQPVVRQTWCGGVPAFGPREATAVATASGA